MGRPGKGIPLDHPTLWDWVAWRQATVATSKPIAGPTNKEIRKRISKLVRRAALEKRLTFSEAWSVLYRRMRDRTGFDAIARGIARGTSYVTTVEKAGKLHQLLDVAEKL